MKTLDSTLPRYAAILTAVLTVLVVVALPLVYFSIGYGAQLSANRIKAALKADVINQLVTISPDMWRYEEHRLVELLGRHPLELTDEQAIVFDAKGELIVQAGAEVAAPPLVSSEVFYDAGQVVGRVEIRQSLRPLWMRTALAALLGALLAGAVFTLLRVLPRRAQQLVDAMFAEKERALVTLHSIGDGVITTDAQQRIDYLNPVAEKLSGWTQAEARGRPLAEVMNLVEETTQAPAQNPMALALHDNAIRSFTTDVALLRRDGSAVAIEDSAAPIHDREGRVVGGVMVFHDVTVARSMARRISWAATHDALTGLVNRREFETRVDAALGIAVSAAQRHVLCYLDLDQFKVINDTCGHAAGDALLKLIAALLQDKLRASDTLARLGGDEFGILLDSCPLERATLIAADMLAAVQDFRFQCDGKVFTVGVSIGLVEISEHSGSRAELFSAADTACYAAKEQGRNRVCVFQGDDADMTQRRREMGWASRLNLALEQNRFELYYQPYLPLGTGGAQGAHIEILLRLIDEDGTVVAPGSFLPAAERYNIAPAIDRWVIRNTLARYHELATQLGAPLTCGINLSGTSINSEGLLDFIREQTRLHDIPRGGICFEITETAAVHNLRRAAQFMRDIKDMGYLFALDDFGTGTSSFGYLKNLPVDYLKIDGSFVRDIADDPLDRAMAETINRIGHLMGLKTVGEFAETDVVISALRSLGVNYAQGYGVQEPKPLPGPRKPFT
ncbi:MAG: EAL domain-containing protein [Hylemonella sp.]|nr:EAL domain-containing protein [Hylemonella sp.]